MQLRESLEFDIKNLDGEVILKAGEKLAGANLRRADLKGVNLSRSNLTESNLIGAALGWASLMGSDLTRACLSGVELIETDLRVADLDGVNFTMANLTKAGLWGANLSEANFTGANLNGADLSKVWLYNTIGNGKEIYTIQSEYCTINITKDIIQIGCEQHTREEWYSFSDKELSALGVGVVYAPKFWHICKPIIQSIDQGLFRD